MSFIKQILMSVLVIGIVLALWVTYVPSSLPWLAKTGVLDALGIEVELSEPAAGSGGGWRGASATAVVVAEVALLRQRDQISAIGNGRALHSATVRSDVAGRINALETGSGRYIEAGEVLLRLEDSAERIGVDRARLMVVDAEQELERVNTLSGTGAVTAVRQQEARLALQTARLALQQAEFELDQKVVRAPISGWVGLIEPQAGDRVTAQDTIVTITDRSRIVVDFRVPERVIGQLSTGMPFWAEPLAHRGLVLEGEISAIDNIVDRNSRTLRVQGTLENADDMLRDGMAFSVSMSFAGTDYPAVPPLAVQWSSEGSFVWAVEDGKAVRVPVRIMQRNAESVLVEADLAAGTLIVVEGVQTLRPGAEVEISSEVTAAPEAAVVRAKR